MFESRQACEMTMRHVADQAALTVTFYKRALPSLASQFTQPLTRGLGPLLLRNSLPRALSARLQGDAVPSRLLAASPLRALHPSGRASDLSSPPGGEEFWRGPTAHYSAKTGPRCAGGRWPAGRLAALLGEGVWCLGLRACWEPVHEHDAAGEGELAEEVELTVFADGIAVEAV